MEVTHLFGITGNSNLSYSRDHKAGFGSGGRGSKCSLNLHFISRIYYLKDYTSGLLQTPHCIYSDGHCTNKALIAKRNFVKINRSSITQSVFNFI